MMNDLSGRIALIAGAGGGFGSAICQRMAAQGASVALVGRHASSLDPVAEEISRSGGTADIFTGDMTKHKDVSAVYERISQTLGKPTIFVGAAAVPGPFGPIGYFNPDEWWEAMSVHLRAPVLLIHEVLPEMLRLERGHVILLSSFVGNKVYPHLSAYSLGKGAQTSLMAQAAAEHRDSGVCFFSIQPGFSYTKMTRQTLQSPEFQRWAPEAANRMQTLLMTNEDERVRWACAERCCDLAAGHYDALSGLFLQPEDNLEDLLNRSASPPI